MIRLTHGAIDSAALTAAVCRPECGAVVTFLGTVREITGELVTEALEYEAYAPLATAELQAIAAEAQARWQLGGVAIEHRLGQLAVGEIAVCVAVSAPHRAAAFDAARHVMERIKQRVPIWKREQFADGRSEWQHPPEVPPP